MRVYRRVGEDTSVSYTLWPYVLSAFILIGIATSDPVLLIPIGILLGVPGGIWLLSRRPSKEEREYERLAARERYEQAMQARVKAETARRAEVLRLRSKYDR